MSTDAEAELAALQERHHRLAADFDNFRKRTARDNEQRAAAQKDAFIRELLPVVDNLERALDAATARTDDPLRRGVELTLNQLRELLRQHDIEAEHSLGEPFDPHRHEALGTRAEPTLPDHVIVDEMQRGYRRGDEVIRHARVIINDLGGQPHRHGR